MTRRKPPAGVEERAKDNRDRLSAMASVAAKLDGWKPQAEVIRNVEAVPTIFPQLDHVTKVGGFPISRFALVHGPSNEGKTEFCLGLGLSFLRRNHFFGLADAERTTTSKWVRSLMGELADHPGFRALPVKSYEHVRESVRAFCETIANARERGELESDTTGLVVVDSIRKLVPKKLWDELAKMQADAPEGKGAGGRKKRDPHIDGYGGRAAQMKAAMNAAWVDELIPLLADTRMALAVIARETKDGDADQWSGKDWKVGGGTALYYDASLDIRLTRSWVRDTDGRDIGERHRIEVHKTKIGGKDTRVPVAHFHTSNGIATPAGFDFARDVLELGLDLDVLKLNGSFIKYGSRSLGQGVNNAVKLLSQDRDLCAELERDVRAASAADPEAVLSAESGGV